MRLYFWIGRANHLKIVGPIAQAARRRGHETVAVVPVPPLAADGGKDIVSSDHLAIREAVGSLWRVCSRPDAISLLRHQVPTWMIGVGLRLTPWLRAATRHEVKWASLDHIQESLLQILEDGASVLDGWDLVTTSSEEGIRAMAMRYWQTHGPEPVPDWASIAHCEETLEKWFLSRILPIGMPHLDPLVGMDKTACRAKWNLPTGRIVLLAPAAKPALLDPWWWRAYTARNPLWRRFCWLKASRWSRVRDDRHGDEKVGLMPYRDILRAFRRWADRHGAFIVAKVRAKTPCVHFLNGIADRVIGDEAFHPFTTLELCCAADAYVGLASAMAIEATAAGLPQIHVLAYPSEAYEVPVYLPFRRRFYLTFPGLWTNWGSDLYRTYQKEGREKFRRWAAEDPWPDRAGPDWNPLRRLAGPPDGRASDRLLNLLDRPSTTRLPSEL